FLALPPYRGTNVHLRLHTRVCRRSSCAKKHADRQAGTLRISLPQQSYNERSSYLACFCNDAYNESTTVKRYRNVWREGSKVARCYVGKQKTKTKLVNKNHNFSFNSNNNNSINNDDDD
ncbi:unnamed protein product, partial [Ectocarpus sp. 8 AP-2014]